MMSTFTNYDSVCQNYDRFRVAYGADLLLEKITSQTGKVKEMGVAKISLYDASNGMLGLAKDKLKPFVESGRVVSIDQGFLPSIPFPDGEFDAIMLNCVIHHLDSPEERRTFPNARQTIKEAFRVIKPNGLFTSICQYPDQLAGEWFTQLLPKKLDDFRRRFPDADDIRSMITEAGFSGIEETCLYGVDYSVDYHNPDGPFSESWRASDSYWSHLDEMELKLALDNLEKIKSSGKTGDFVKENDGSMTKGSFTMITAKKIE